MEAEALKMEDEKGRTSLDSGGRTKAGKSMFIGNQCIDGV